MGEGVWAGGVGGPHAVSDYLPFSMILTQINKTQDNAEKLKRLF